jgi:hypothetical protein
MTQVKPIILGLVASIASLLLLATPAWSAECDDLLAEVDALLATGTPDIAEDLLVEAQALRDVGVAECAAGNDAEAIAQLSQAKFMLGGYAAE